MLEILTTLPTRNRKLYILAGKTCDDRFCF